MKKNKASTLTPERFFFSGLVLLVCLTLVQFPFNHGESFFSLLHPDSNDIFMDFFNSVYDADYKNPYTERGVIYPPLAYLFYRFWTTFLCSRRLADEIAGQCGLPMTGARYWSFTQSGVLIITLVTLISVYLLYRILLQGQENNKTYRRNVLLILLGTVPFWYLYERGNLVLQTLVFLTFYLKNYRSEDIILRELSLISLAIAVSFKIYPMVFGILLIMDKKYKEAFRWAVYAVAAFFLPFMQFGGIRTVLAMISNIMSTTQGFLKVGHGYKVNIDNTITFLLDPFQLQLSSEVILIIKLMLAACILFALFTTQKEWQRYMVLCAVMMIFPGFSYTYTLTFAAIPLLAFLADNPKTTVRNLLFAVLFLGMFAPFPFEGAELFDYASKIQPSVTYHLNLTSAISSLSLVGMIVLITVDTVCCKVTDPVKPVTKWNNNRTVTVFGITLLVIISMLFCGYAVCNQQYKEPYMAIMRSMDEALSRYIDDDDLVMYFSHEPFFEEAPLRHYREIRWSPCSKAPEDQLNPMPEEAFQRLMFPVKGKLPKAFIYCVYPYPEADVNFESQETFNQTYTLSDHLRQFVFENRYTIVETYSVNDIYRILVYVNLKDNK